MAGCTFQFGLPYLVPHLRAEGLSLSQAALLVASPSLGLTATLYLWGAAADRWGERVVLASGLALAAPALAAAAWAARAPGLAVAPTAALLVAGGAASASVHAASGRLILGWFAVHERGLAMGIRQTAQPLGVGIAALALPGLAGHGISTALLALAGFCLAAAALVAAVVRDPAHSGARPDEPAPSPYRTPVLWRIHAASALLVVPQFTVGAFGLAFLVDARGWSAVDGGRLLALAQLGGAAVRLGAGWWSDRVGSRTGPLRRVAVAVAVSVGALAVAAAAGLPAAGWLVLAAVITVAPNGLAFTAVAEYAGRWWAGRALGAQNTGQNLVAAITPPIAAELISANGYGPAFGLSALFPLLAAVLVPGHRRWPGPAAHPAPAPAPAPARASAPHDDGSTDQ